MSHPCQNAIPGKFQPIWFFDSCHVLSAQSQREKCGCCQKSSFFLGHPISHGPHSPHLLFYVLTSSVSLSPWNSSFLSVPPLLAPYSCIDPPFEYPLAPLQIPASFFFSVPLLWTSSKLLCVPLYSRHSVCFPLSPKISLSLLFSTPSQLGASFLGHPSPREPLHFWPCPHLFPSSHLPFSLPPQPISSSFSSPPPDQAS